MPPDDTPTDDAELLAQALAALLRVPFIADVQHDRAGGTIYIRIRTRGGEEFVLKPTTDARRVGNAPECLLLVRRAPTAQAEFNYVDAAGNLHLSLGGRYHAHVEGRRASTKTRAMRAPAYRVLLAWLIDPSLISRTIRATAAVAGVSRTAVQHMEARLRQWGYIVGHAERRVWTARGRTEARRMWLEGYRAILRPTLDMPAYRLRDSTPRDTQSVRAILLEHQSAQLTQAWTWAGTEALRHIPSMASYLVDTTPDLHLHLDPNVTDVSSVLPIVADVRGSIRLVRLPFPTAAAHSGLEGWPSSVPHPLMVWTELMCQPEARAQQAATKLMERLPEAWR